MLWTYLLQLATVADSARAETERLARDNERSQQRDILHDPAAVLRLLADPDSLTDEQRTATRRHALALERRMRTFLGAGDQPLPSTPSTLADTLRAAAVDYPDLDITLNVDLAEHEHLRPDVQRALQAAVSTLLMNVRVHAQADHCVIHGDVEDLSWEVVVRDDGIGFNPDTTPRNFGLNSLVAAALNRVGADVTIWSSPGLGTSVTVAGPTTTPRRLVLS